MAIIEMTRAEYEKKYGKKAPAPITVSETTEPEVTKKTPYSGGFFSDVLDTAKDVGIGIGKGALKSAQGLGQTFSRAGEMAVGALTPLTQEQMKGKFGSQETFFKDKEVLESKNLAQGIGVGMEKIGEYVLTAPVSAAANVGLKAISAGLRLGKYLKPTFDIAGKATIEGLKTYGQEKIMAGTDKEASSKAKTAGIVSAAITGTLGTLGQVWKALGEPTKVVSKVLKDNSQSMDRYLNSKALANMEKTNPTEFRQLVSEGVISVDKFGKPIVNKLLAQEALERGIVDTPENFGNAIYTNKRLVDMAKNAKLEKYTEPISLGGKTSEFKKVLQTVIDKADEVGADVDDVATANSLLESLNKGYRGKGTLNANDAYDLRVFIDRMGGPGMFANQNAKITSSLSANQLKKLRGMLKTELDKDPEFAQIMKDYQFYIGASKAFNKFSTQSQGAGSDTFMGGIKSRLLGARLKSAQASQGNKPVTPFKRGIQGATSVGVSDLIQE